MAYGDGAQFFVDGVAEHLWATWLPPLTIEDIATYLLGPVIGFVLRRRGVIALHASAVCIGGVAVAFCGQSEAGKSTLAATLALDGARTLAEDISALAVKDGTFYVEPGYPRICLWPDSVEKLFGAPDALPRLTPTWEKRFLALDGVRAKFEPQKQPLGIVYLLTPRVEEVDAPRIEDLGMRAALLDLVQNTYMNWLLDGQQRADELDVLSALVAQIPVRRVVPHRDPRRIHELRDLILKDAQRFMARQDPAGVAHKY